MSIILLISGDDMASTVMIRVREKHVKYPSSKKGSVINADENNFAMAA